MGQVGPSQARPQSTHTAWLCVGIRTWPPVVLLFAKEPSLESATLSSIRKLIRMTPCEQDVLAQAENKQ